MENCNDSECKMTLEKASLGARFGATMIDLVIILTVFLLPYLLARPPLSTTVFFIVTFLVFFLKDSVKGQSFGKFIFGIAVRDTTNSSNTPSTARLFIRNVTFFNRITGTGVYRIVERKPSVVLLSFLAIGALLFLIFSLIPPGTALSAEEFISYMEEAGFVVEDNMQRWIEADVVDTEWGSIEAALRVETGQFIMEFYVFSTETRARMAYNGTRHDIKHMRTGIASSQTEINLSNFSRFTQTGSERYIVISRIENTLIFLYTHVDNRSGMDALLKMLGY